MFFLDWNFKLDYEISSETVNGSIPKHRVFSNTEINHDIQNLNSNIKFILNQRRVNEQTVNIIKPSKLSLFQLKYLLKCRKIKQWNKKVN